MAVDSLASPKNQPQFDGTKASNTAADQNAIADYAALVGNYIADTASNRTAFAAHFGFNPWGGLHYTETDTGNEYVYLNVPNGATGWVGTKSESGIFAFTSANFTADGGGYSASLTVYLDPTRFTAPPVVTIGTFSAASQNQHAGVANVTATSFTLYYWRANQFATTVGWTASPSDS